MTNEREVYIRLNDRTFENIKSILEPLIDRENDDHSAVIPITSNCPAILITPAVNMKDLSQEDKEAYWDVTAKAIILVRDFLSEKGLWSRTV
jgi:hypothetical protein